MDVSQQRRKVARIPSRCPVVVREKLSDWATETEDLGTRGCRISLRRPLARGRVVQLRFEPGTGQPPLDVVGQVTWCRGASAGVIFITVPRGSGSGHWIDAVVAGDLARVLQSWATASARLSRMTGVTVQLGLPPPPTEALDNAQVALIRLARDGVPFPHLCRSPESAKVFHALLQRGVVSVCRGTPDPEGWKQTFARMHAAALARRA